MPTTGKSSRLTGIAKSIMRLPHDDLHRSFFAIKDYLFPDTKPDIHGRIKDIREARNTSGLACPHCTGEHVVRLGKYGDRQRYRCKTFECGKTFNDTTLTRYGTPGL
jgi:hypothetical protein